MYLRKLKHYVNNNEIVKMNKHDDSNQNPLKHLSI